MGEYHEARNALEELEERTQRSGMRHERGWVCAFRGR
jgi:hypothetical protein